MSARMSKTRGRDTEAEMVVRKALHAAGKRFRVNARPVAEVRRTADILFPRRRMAVLIDGCFWHGCPEHFVIPKTRTEWWTQKIEENRARDRETTRLWQEAGWTVLRFWEHESVDVVLCRIESVLEASDVDTLHTQEPAPPSKDP